MTNCVLMYKIKNLEKYSTDLFAFYSNMYDRFFDTIGNFDCVSTLSNWSESLKFRVVINLKWNLVYVLTLQHMWM